MTLVQRIGRVGVAAGIVLVLGALAAPVFGADAAVSVVGKSFEPRTLTIAQGDTPSSSATLMKR